MTERAAIAERIRSALARELKRETSAIRLDHALRDDLGLNSLDAIELMFKVEEEFDLVIPDADLQKLVTVQDLVSYIEARLVPSRSSPPATPSAPPTRSSPSVSTPKASGTRKPTSKTSKAKRPKRHA